MGLRIYNNVEAQNAHRQLANTNIQVTKAIQEVKRALLFRR